ncbi:Protein VAC14-like protein [Aphelenchoides bicaudatus]|nr:Protein VAC14-like protein [Aphelenchoides bicaudatus]
MAENKYAPLSATLVRSLTDKLYEKRKQAALEIEKCVKDLIKQNRTAELERLVEIMVELTATPNGNVRKGGLMGLAAVSIGLGKNYPDFSDRLLISALTCFSDADSRVRYFACESLYNVVKICRSSTLKHFEQLFNALWKLSCDTEQTVRSGAELLDRLVKEIVRSSPEFDVEQLMLLIRERIYTNNSSNRRFIISWLHTVLKMPGFTITSFVPEVVDGLFRVLDDQSVAVHDTSITVLSELLHCLDPEEGGNSVSPTSIINILVTHTNGPSPPAREIALIWLSQFCVYYKKRILDNLAGMLAAALPYLHDEKLKAKELNQRLTEFIDPDAKINLDSVVDVLLEHTKHDCTETRIETLNWFRLLHQNLPNQMFNYMDRIFVLLLEALQDSADDVLMLDIMLITDICSKGHHEIDLKAFNLSDSILKELGSTSPYLIKFTISLLDLFKKDTKLIDDRGIQIIRQLCLLLEPADVYRSIAVLMNATIKDVDFLSRIVAMLNRILLTSNELFRLRIQLKNPDENNVVSLFECLYRCWCHQPICLLSLCLLSQNYEHASDLAIRLSEIDLTVDILMELDRLIQLIESPILAYVRMDLLSSSNQRPLASTLSALLMLLPQTEAFNTLHKRLQVIPHLQTLESPKKHGKKSSSLDFKQLLAYFDKVTESRKINVRAKHLEHLKLLTQNS